MANIGRGKKKVTDRDVLDIQKKIKSGKFSLRQGAKALGMSHVALGKRLKKLTGDIEEKKVPFYEDSKKVTVQTPIEKVTIEPKKVTKNMKKVTNRKLSSTKLRGWYEDLTFDSSTNKGKSHRGSRNECIDLIIKELLEQKDRGGD